MVILLDGSSDIGEHARSNICNLNCLKAFDLIKELMQIGYFFFRNDLISLLWANHV